MRLAIALLACAMGASALGLASTTQAREITAAEERELPFDAQIPVCHDPAVLERITAQFAERETRFWTSNLRLVRYEHIRPVAWRPWGLDYVPRRLCTGTVLVSDGRKRRVTYQVKEDLGFLGTSWGVTWCVVGLDRHRAYEPACQVLTH